MARAKVRKHLYWHKIAKVLLEHGLMPKHVAEAIKRVYPLAEVTGRHVGAYKRRLINEGVVEKDTPRTGSEAELIQMAHEVVSDEDKFVYDCSVASKVRTLKCFEYKMTQATIDIVDDCDEWIAKIK